MPGYAISYLPKWCNYHLTSEGRHLPDGTVYEIAELFCADAAGMAGPAMFAASGDTLRALLREMTDRIDRPAPPMRRKPYPRSCGIAGRGWSFADLIAADDLLIDLAGLAGVAPLDPADQHPDSGIAPGRVVLALGGTRLREIVNWGSPRGLSIETSGTHLGPSVAGAAATASHGSRLGHGGIQNLVCGMHFVTGPDRSVWVQSAANPILRDDVARQFANDVISDDAVFDNALVHLGAMGIVNGVALRLVTDESFSHRFRFARIDADWLEKLAAGAFGELASRLGLPRNPAFYELTIDPFAWDGSEAIHNFYLPVETSPLTPADPVKAPLATDFLPAAIEQLSQKERAGGLPSVFEMYRGEVDEVLASGTLAAPRRWSELHGDVITGGFPGALWNASFAIPREALPAVIPLICKAVEGCLPTFLYTIRFVSGAKGSLAFTHFGETAVIEIDGISAKAPNGLGQFGGEIVKAARRLRDALDAAVIDGKPVRYAMHWAKLGDLDVARVADNFGDPQDHGSRIAGWRRTRERLVPEARIRNLFTSPALVGYGLLDQPPAA